MTGPCDDGHEVLSPFCPKYQRALEIVGRRWTGVILRFLLSGASRFNSIAQGIPGLTDRLLSERLKELEAEGLVVRSVTPETPVRIEYHLTPKGRALESVIRATAKWAEDWSEPSRRKQTRGTTGGKR
ncbi:MAG TPA: helix-turn-helix domain-containing protein [Actinomycetota bacterium]|nr:helix-turn-helix domain-containing protein [Actinomycetota bacterium]